LAMSALTGEETTAMLPVIDLDVLP
jgi:hypothetical protein